MTFSFDIFQNVAYGNILWIEAAPTIEDATARVKSLGSASPSEYLILCQKTGTRHVIKPDGIQVSRQAVRGGNL